MAAAYIEPRPKSREPRTAISHYTIVSEGEEHGEFKTQEAAIDHECEAGYRPVHVARVRHSHEHDNPDHFRKHTRARGSDVSISRKVTTGFMRNVPTISYSA